jgi:type II secretory pathway component GspD/PulD (secretin)
LDQLLTRVSEATGKKFLVDPRVRVRVYGVPKIENVTYAELLTILRIHGFAAVEIGGRVNIPPDANVRFLPVRFEPRRRQRERARRQADSDGYVREHPPHDGSHQRVVALASR